MKEDQRRGRRHSSAAGGNGGPAGFGAAGQGSRFGKPAEAPTPIKTRMVYISLLAIVVGCAGGMVAEGLLDAINFISNLCFYGKVSFAYLPPNLVPHSWITVLLPGIGGFGVGLLIHYCSPEIKGDGIPEAMSVVLTNRSVVKPRVSFFKPLSAAITVGSGGPFGAEGPIIQTGAALGSMLSQLIPASPSERRTLLACGAAAGLAGVFKTPFAGAMIAVELLVFEFRARSFIPIALASATGTMVAMGFRGAQAVFPVDTNFHFHPAELPFFVLLGIFCAALAWAMTKALYFCEDFFDELKVWFPVIPMMGGLFVGVIAWFYPQVLGTGYAVIADVLAKPHPLSLLLGIGVAKLASFAVALGSGSSGGTFAPALMIGGSLGAAYGSLIHMLLPSASSIGLYGMVATAALFGSLYRATPSAILFMLEVTGAWNAILPVFLVAVVADLAVHYFMRTTINTERLVRRGTLVPDAYVVDPMRILRVSQVMESNFDSVQADKTVEEFLPTAMRRESVPVVDDKEQLVGILNRDDLMLADSKATAGSLARHEFPYVYGDEVVHDVALRFLGGKFQSCPVLDRQSGALMGMLTPFDVLKAKHWEHLQEMTEPGWWNFSMLRFGGQAGQAVAEQPEEEPEAASGTGD